MFERILIPLDGSEWAEMAIPYVQDLIGELEAEVHLVHACSSEQKTDLRIHQFYMNNVAQDLRQNILKKWQHRVGPRIYAEAFQGDPVRVILDYVRQKSINLVALTNHGSSGTRGRPIGEVADKLVRGVAIPILLVRIKEGFTASEHKGPIQKILLPVDTSDGIGFHITCAAQLAKKLNASIALLSVTQSIYAQNVESMAAGFIVNWDSIDASNRQYVDEYLQRMGDEIRKVGVEVTQTNIVSTDAAHEILEMEKKIQPDLVVMAARGRSKIGQWALGTVAEKVFREGHLPILMVTCPR